DKDRQMLHLEHRTLQHFLKGPGPTLQCLLAAASAVSGFPDCSVVINSDVRKVSRAAIGLGPEETGLEDVEMQLMAEWMFRPNVPDFRFLLRDALHDPALKEKGYRYVLIDCPPRLSTACVNALGACDFFLIPVLLDATSARSAPNLLRTLSVLRTSAIFPHLKCLGIVANEATLRGGGLIAREAKTWQDLRPTC